LEVSVYRADPTTWLDVITGLSPILGALLAIGGVLLTLRSNNRRERDRQKNERLLKDAELEAQKQARLRDERIIAYRKFLAATTTAHVEREGVEAMAAAYAEVSLLASTDEIARVAYGVWVSYDRAQRIFAKTRRRERAAKNPSSLVAQYRHRAEEERVRFLMLAQAELGIEGRSTGYRDAEWMTPDEALPDPEEGSQERREDASG
jgi:hypothetical protein